MNSPREKIAIFVSFSGQGGVERMIVNLLQGMVDRGAQVDLVLVKAVGAHAKAIPPGVNVVRLNARHTLTSLPGLVCYLRRARPQAVLAVKDRAGKVAVLARWLSRVPTRVVIRIGTTVSAALAGRGRLKHSAWYAPMRVFYPRADAIVAVSEGVARDIMAITGLATERVAVIRNPVVSDELHRIAAGPVSHPWFRDAEPPVIMGAGRITRQKDFATLIRAFARVRAQRPCRLVIFGDGAERVDCEALAHSLGVADDVAFPGFVTDLAAYTARARLFVLSSRWEGSPNVLTEALALGVPAVATDCPSGPREILADGRFGALVPVGDAEQLARAISDALEAPLDSAVLQSAVADYTVAVSTQRYLEVLGVQV